MAVKTFIIEDLCRTTNGKYSHKFLLLRLFFNHSFKIMFFFRIANSNSIFNKIGSFFLRRNSIKYSIQLPKATQVGKGLLFAHYGCIVINSSSKIGDNVTIFQGVTIGSQRGSGAPVIGNGAVLFSGSKVIGSVKLGENTIVAANAVVVSDVPANAVVAGVPAKIINYNGLEISKLYRY